MNEMIPISRVIEKLDACFQVNDMTGAKKHLLYWIDEAQAIGDNRSLITLYNEAMGLYRKMCEKEKAIEYAQSAEKLLEKADLSETASGATCLMNCATVYSAFDAPDKAISLYEKAKVIYETQNAVSNELIACLYNNASMAYLALREYDKADEYCKKALQILPFVKNSEPEQAVSWLNMASVLYARFSYEDCFMQIENCLHSAENLLELDCVEHNGNYAFVCTKCAPVFDGFGYFDYAKKLRERAKKIYEGA